MTIAANLPTRMLESSGTVYYVDKDTGSDSDSGLSEALAWATMSKAFTTASANSIVRVKKGASPYTESLTISTGGTANNVITVEAFDTNKPIIVGVQTFQGVSAAYWRLRNLIFDGNNANTAALKITFTGGDKNAAGVGANHIEVYGCEMKNTSGNGGCCLVTGAAVNNVQWWNCLFQDADHSATGAHGVYLNQGDHFYLINCESYDNGGYGYHLYLDPDRTNLKTIYFHNCLAARNKLRGGWLIQGDNGAGGIAYLPQDVHWYNCISAHHDETPGTQNGWLFRAAGATDFTSFLPHTLDNCAAYSNVNGDYSSENVLIPVTNTNFGTGEDPRFMDVDARDFGLQAGTPARSQPVALKANTWEGGTNGVTISAANSGGASGDAVSHLTIGSGNTLVYDTANAQGSLSAKMTFGGTSTGEFGWDALGSITAPVWIRAVFAVSALPTVGVWFDFVRLSNNASSRCCSISLRTDGLIRIDNASGTQINTLTGSTVIAPNTLYRIEMKVTPSTTVGEIEWWLYPDPASGIASFTDHHSETGLVLAANIDAMWVGNPSTAANTAGKSGWWDSIAVSTADQLGPAGGASFIVNPMIEAGLLDYTPTVDYNGRERFQADIGPEKYLNAVGWHGRDLITSE